MARTTTKKSAKKKEVKKLALTAAEKRAKKKSKLGGADSGKKIETCISALEACYPDPDGDGWAKKGSTYIYYTPAQEQRRAKLLREMRQKMTQFQSMGNAITTYGG